MKVYVKTGHGEHTPIEIRGWKLLKYGDNKLKLCSRINDYENRKTYPLYYPINWCNIVGVNFSETNEEFNWIKECKKYDINFDKWNEENLEKSTHLLFMAKFKELEDN